MDLGLKDKVAIVTGGGRGIGRQISLLLAEEGAKVGVNDPKFATLVQRQKNEEELNTLVEQWTSHYPAEDVMIRMQAAGVPAGLVENSKDQFVYDPQLKHRGALWPVDHPEIGTYHVQAPSFQLMKSEYELQSAPLLGADNEYVLSKVLGLSDDEISDLVISGAIE